MRPGAELLREEAVPGAERGTVHVVEDDPELASYLRSVLASLDLDVRLHAQASEFLADYRPHSPECLLVDVRLPGISGLELQRRLIHKHATLPVVFMTGYGTTAVAVRAMKQGAFDFFEKPFNPLELLGTVQAALERDRAEQRRRDSHADLRARFARLTEREREILALVVEGEASKGIAERIGLSKKTVDGHRALIMRKLGTDSLIALVKLAVLHGALEREDALRIEAAPPER